MAGHAINSRFVPYINMKIKTLKFLFAVILPLIVGQSFVSCKHGNPEVNALLDHIEQVVQQRPDSALIELVHLDSLLDAGAVSIEGDRQMARYALLKTQTHDKNWIDDTNDSLILQAVRYYDDHGSKRERMLAHYYLACIFRNSRDFARAYSSYLYAAEQATELENHTIAGMAYGNIASICRELYSGEDLLYADYSYQSYQMAGDSARMNWALMQKGIALNYQNRYNEAEAIFERLLHVSSDLRLRQVVTSYYLYQSVKQNRYQKADSLIQLQSSPKYFIDYLCRAIVFENQNRQVEADSCLQYAKIMEATASDRVLMFATYADIQNMRHQYKESSRTLARLAYLTDSIVRSINTASVSVIQRDYVQLQLSHSEALMQEKNYRYKAVLMMSVLLLLLAGIILQQRFRRKDLLIQHYLDIVAQLGQEMEKEQSWRKRQETKRKTEEAISREIERHKRKQIQQLFKERIRKINQMYSRLYLYGEADIISEKEKIYKEACNEIAAIQKPSFINGLITSIDDSFDGLMNRARENGIVKTDEDYSMLCLLVAGFSANAICLLLTLDNRNIIYKRRQRIKERIRQSSFAYKADLLQLIE